MNDDRFPTHSHDTLPEGGERAFDMAEQGFGMIPNLTRKMATAPALAEAYLTLSGLFDQTSLSTVERQVVLLTVSRYHDCRYCMGAHSWLADQAGTPADAIQAIRDDGIISDPRLEALRRFTTAMVDKRGWVNGEVGEFLAAGFDPRQVLEVILGVGLKTLSNYTNHVAGTGLDEAFAEWAWAPPQARS